MVKKPEDDQTADGLRLDDEPALQEQVDPNLRPVSEQADIQRLDATPPPPE